MLDAVDAYMDSSRAFRTASAPTTPVRLKLEFEPRSELEKVVLTWKAATNAITEFFETTLPTLGEECAVSAHVARISTGVKQAGYMIIAFMDANPEPVEGSFEYIQTMAIKLGLAE
jgi:hypothetical protein